MTSFSIPNNDDTINRYVAFLELQSFRPQTIESKVWNVKMFAKHTVYIDLNIVSQTDIENYVIALKKSKKTEGTQKLNVLHLQSFYAWLKPGNDLFANIKLRRLKKDTSKKEYINSDDVIKLLTSCRNQRDRALIFVLWESGARIGEIVALNVGDVKPEQHGIVITVTGKTGKRDILLIDAVPDLQIWLNNYHADKSAPLFPVSKGTRLTRKGAQNFIRRTAERAGIEGKQISPHSYRHGRLSELSNLGLSEMQLRHYAGWTNESEMPSVYIHAAQKDVFDKLKAIKGIKPENEEEIKPEVKTIPKKCPRCSTENPFDSKYCRSCSLILDPKTALEIETEGKKLDNHFMQGLLEHPEAFEKFAILVADFNKSDLGDE
jgi:integrase/recombinase XerD